MTTTDAPERIFLVPFGGDGELMWSTDGDSQYDPAYIREDIYRARIEALEVALKEQVAFHAMDLSMRRSFMDRNEIEDIEYRRDRARAALTGAKP